MSSAVSSHTPTSAKRNLQRLRREAGYRNAKDFAEALGIPASTYSRYERAEEGPACGIPLPSAWSIADELGVSIDLVVGREDIDATHEETLDERAGALTRESRRMLLDYLGYLESRDAEEAEARRRGGR
jgi:transcriptional regulator with XRE-family HTH domain